MLTELNELSRRNDTNILRLIANLEPAIQLVEHDSNVIIENELKSSLSTVLSSQLKSLLIEHRDIFPFEWALPSRRFLSNHKSKQTIFTEADDHLIAFGFQRFYRERSKSVRNNSVYEYIQDHLLPIHSKRSIKHHVTFLKRAKKMAENDPEKYDKWFTNPIVYYFRENKLPPFNRYFSRENLSNIYRLYPLPDWYQKYMAKDDPTNKMLYIDDCKKNIPQQTKSNDHSSSSSSSLSRYPPIIPKPDSNGNFPLYGLHGQQVIFDDGTIVQNILANQSFPFCKVPNLPRRRQVQRKTKKQQSSKNDEQTISNAKICPSVHEILIDANQNQPPKISVDEMDKIEIDEYDELDQVHDSNGDDDDDDDDDDVDVDVNDDDDDDDDDDDGSAMLMNMDDEEDLMALMEASWTTVANNGKPQQQRLRQDQDDIGRINRRKSDLLAMQRESCRYIIEHSSSNIEHSINDRLISYYLKRSRKLLVQDEDYIRFLESISKINDQAESNDQIYHQLRKFLLEIRWKYVEQHSDNVTARQQIMDGFDELVELLVLLVLVSSDRFENNSRLTFQYLHWLRILQFFRKLELYLSFVYDGHTNQQQNCVQKMLRLLNQSLLQQKPHTSKMTNEQRIKIKTSVSKILNNHPLLMKEFCSLFLEDPPPDHLFGQDEDFDEFIIPSDIDMENHVVDEDVENCTIPIDPNDSKYGTNECPCIECDHQMVSKNSALNSHCAMCSIRFISGRIYLPQISTNKRLQLVEYVPRPQSPFGKIDSNNRLESNETSAWTLQEDRLLLQTCRSMIIDFNITNLSEHIIDRLAIKLANENVFNQKRSTFDISERLKHLIEILTC
ncbi:hypothetical protein BLA29_000056 [Euroglyphus maynei]|uniref:Uncharacterized protein n=1 Tax=Euroglyphus maynei TaxID=6958 RepID=A0A1Y3B7G6_EURMA|nr:hypothetical protein BLA29_000056 [Euroglyphus maynei]